MEAGGGLAAVSRGLRLSRSRRSAPFYRATGNSVSSPQAGRIIVHRHLPPPPRLARLARFSLWGSRNGPWWEQMATLPWPQISAFQWRVRMFLARRPFGPRQRHNLKRPWRNWQTRWLQVPVGVTPWRFESSRPQSSPCELTFSQCRFCSKSTRIPVFAETSGPSSCPRRHLTARFQIGA